jgi:hypothetical protein
MSQRPGPYKYDPLVRYLAALPEDQVTLSLAEIAAIIGAPLPASAQHASFWANSPMGVFRVRPWVEAGWRMARTDLRHETPAVTFVRAAR